jgi:broad specificity phosphatase PhoE
MAMPHSTTPRRRRPRALQPYAAAVLLLVRHGQTAPNADGLLLGRADPPLTDLGRLQARSLAAALPRPARVISSPLERARRTAEAFGVPVEIDERWTELDYGELDGRPASALADDRRACGTVDVSYAPPGGESLAALGARVRAACTELVDAATTSVVVVVTHVSPIKAAVAWALGVPDTIAWRMYVEDASVSRIDIGPAGPVVRWFNRGPAPAP